MKITTKTAVWLGCVAFGTYFAWYIQNCLVLRPGLQPHVYISHYLTGRFLGGAFAWLSAFADYNDPFVAITLLVGVLFAYCAWYSSPLLAVLILCEWGWAGSKIATGGTFHWQYAIGVGGGPLALAGYLGYVGLTMFIDLINSLFQGNLFGRGKK